MGQYAGEAYVEYRPGQLGVPLSPSTDHSTIDLHIALKPDRENALIEALYEVSDPMLPKHVPLPLFRPLAPVLTCTIQGAGRRASRTAPRYVHVGHFLARTQWRALPRLKWRRLVDRHWGFPCPKLMTFSARRIRFTGTLVRQKTILRTLSYSIPAALHEHVRTVCTDDVFLCTA